MKIVCSSDWHGDFVTDGFPRAADLERVLGPVLEAACNADAFLFLGDLTDPYSRYVHRALRMAVGFASVLNSHGVPNYWLVGNHDVVESSGEPEHALLALADVGSNTHVIDKPCAFEINYLKVIALPFTAPALAYDPEDFIRKCAASKVGPAVPDSPQTIIMGHLNIQGIGPGSETTDMARGRDVFWPEAAVDQYYPRATCMNGHYHKRQVFKRVHIPGSLLWLTHGEEANEPGYLEFRL